MNTPHGFALVVVAAMPVFYALEKLSRWFIVAFAGACIVVSIDGFLQSAWGLGLAGSIWSVLAMRRWRIAQHAK